MPESKRLRSGTYLVALVAVAAVGAVRFAVSGTLGGSASFLVFILGVTLVAGYGGLGPGLLATVLGAIMGTDTFQFAHRFPSWTQGASDALTLTTFLVAGVTVSTLFETARSARRRAKAEQRHLEHQGQRLQDAEAGLRASEERLQRTFELGLVGVAITSPSKGCLVVNDELCSILGYSRDELLKKTWDEFTHPADLDADIALFNRVLAGEMDGYSLRKRYVRKDRRVVHAKISVKCVRDAEGQVEYFVGIMQDLTEHRRMEHGYAQSRNFLEHLTSVTPDWLAVYDLVDQQLVYINRTIASAVGYALEQLNDQGDPATFFVHPEDVGRVRTFFMGMPTAADEEVRSIEHRIRHADGSYRWMLMRVKPFERMPNGRIQRVICVSTDITELKLAEARLRETEEALREADRRKDEFIAVLAHELRNPLAPVRNAAHALKARGEPELSRFIDIIDRQITQMTGVVDDLLDVSRSTRGVIELQLDSLAFGELLEAAIDACRAQIEGRDHTLHVRVPSVPVVLNVDRHRFIQVLSNLIMNAARYTPPGGRIDIEARTPTGMLEVSIRDNGVGIPPDKLPHIFEPFVQADRSVESQGGLGIGLTIARQLLVLHGGTIEARSEGIGRGSEFIVRLPVAVTPASRAIDREVEPAPEPRRVLVADDNRDAAESLAIILHAAGHDVRFVLDGATALRMAAEFRPDVAFVDLGMPKMNGYDVARSMREQPWGKTVRLVALTGWGHFDDRQRTEEAGFDDHMLKPVDPNALLRVVAEVESPA